MYLGKVYFHFSFLERVFFDITNSLQDIYSFTSEESENQYLRDLILFIKRSDLVIDLTPEEIVNSKNPIIKLIAKSPAVKLIPNPRVFEELKDETFFENKFFDFFFLDIPSTLAKELEEKFGILIFTPETYKKRLNLLFEYQDIDVKKNDSANRLWGYLSKNRHPINSLILVDNYVLNNNRSGVINISNIIKSIQSSFLLKKDLCITIFTIHEVSANNLNNLTRNLKILGLNAKVRLVKIDPQQNHDRNIYTNYFRISSGFGFDIVKKFPEFETPVIYKDTTFFVRPFSLANDRSTIKQLKESLRKLSEIDKNAKKGGSFVNWSVGANKNQLLEV
jgi:hypothetical protein